MFFSGSIHTVFGQVLQGVEVVLEIENQRVDNKSRPMTDVRVSNCGELILKIKAKGEHINDIVLFYSNTMYTDVF